MRQSYEKNLADLNDFPWENFMKLISGPLMKQWLLNWMDSFAEGKLNDGTTIEEAIAELRLNGGGGSGDGNVFSPQFKLIDGKIYWDPSYFLAKYPTTYTYEFLFDRFTSTSGATALTDIGTIGKYNFDTVASRLRMECDVRITNNTATDLTGVGIGIANNLTISFGSEVAIDPESYDWQTVSFDYPPAASLTEFNNVVLALRSSSDMLESINGSVLDVRNVKIYDEENNLITVTSIVGYNATYSEEEEGTVAIEPDLKGTRVQGLILEGAGVKPTVPAEGVMPSHAEWLETDILPNEVFAFNITDEKFYYNNGSEIKEFTGGGTPITVDEAPTESSSNPVSSGGVFTELGKKADKPATQTEKKLWYTGPDGNPVETQFTYDQIFQFGDMDVSSWLEGEQRLVLITKSEGLPALQNAAELRDIFAPPGVDAQLLDNTGWVDEAKTLTGENYRGELGNPGQVRILQYGTYCWCESSTQGTDGGGDGSSTWKRNRAVDVLDPDNNTQDSNVCDQLNPMRTGGNTDDGWDLVNNTKVLTIPARWGTWWKDTAGYMYFCYAVNGTSSYWWRNGTPQAIYTDINTTSHPTLTANLLAHDFATSRYVEQVGDETSVWGQHFYDYTSRKEFRKVSSTEWENYR